MIQTISKMTSAITQAEQIAKENFNNADSVAKVESTGNELISRLNHDSYVKIPFVGGFNAGKSSLLNAYMGIDLLPTDIKPETAVAYEMYYAEQEHLELWKDDKLAQTAPLSQIKALAVKPGDVVRVYVNNDKIKALTDRNIVVVDMPGLDSGLEAHNNAILHYIHEGVHFVLVHEITQGTLHSSTINFIGEIKKYSLATSVILSKADKLPAEEIDTVKNEIGKQAKFLIGPDVYVGVASNVDKNVASVDEILSTIDADEAIKGRYQNEVKVLIGSIVDELELQIKLLLTSKADYTERIQKLENAKEEAIKKLQEKNGEAQDLKGSANDILNDVYEALIAKSSSLAQTLYTNGNDTNAFNQAALNIIRPVLIDSFKRELSEYQDVIGQALQSYAVDINSILNDSDNDVLSKVKDMSADLLGQKTLEMLLKKGLDALLKRFVQYKGLSMLLKSLGKLVGPIVVILTNILPDILTMIFGKSKAEKIEQLRSTLINKVFGQIIEGMRPEIESMLQQQRDETLQAVNNMIEEEAKKYDANIEAMRNEQTLSEQETTEKVAKLKAAIEKLETLYV